MRELIKKKANLQEQVEAVEAEINAEIQRIVKVFKSQKYEGDTEQAYASGSAIKTLLGTHLIPEYFDDVHIDNNIVHATGMFYGSLGYHDQHTIRFPEEWLLLTDDTLARVIQETWKAERDRRIKEIAVSEARLRQKRLEQFRKLQQEFENEQ